MRSTFDRFEASLSRKQVKLYCCETGEYIGMIRSDLAPQKNLRTIARKS